MFLTSKTWKKVGETLNVSTGTHKAKWHSKLWRPPLVKNTGDPTVQAHVLCNSPNLFLCSIFNFTAVEKPPYETEIITKSKMEKSLANLPCGSEVSAHLLTWIRQSVTSSLLLANRITVLLTCTYIVLPTMPIRYQPDSGLLTPDTLFCHTFLKPQNSS